MLITSLLSAVDVMVDANTPKLTCLESALPRPPREYVFVGARLMLSRSSLFSSFAAFGCDVMAFIGDFLTDFDFDDSAF